LCAAGLAAAGWETVSVQSLPTARHEASFVALNGRMYLLGGRGVKPVEEFDPTAKTWRKLAPTPIEMHHFQALAMDGKIWVIGAMTGPYPGEKPLERVYSFDPLKNEWAEGPIIPKERRRGGAGVVFWKGKVYVVCGIVDGHRGGFVPWLDEWDPKKNVWKELTDAPHARDHFQAAVVDGQIVAAAGRTTSQQTKQTFELTVPEVDVYDIGKKSWRTLPAKSNIPTPRAGNMAAVVDGKVLIAGGESGAREEAHAEVEVLDPKSGLWAKWLPLAQGRHGTGVVVYPGALWVAAGCARRGGNPELNTTERLSLGVQ
jgi:N-acetylneuraminic acid mutarotase